MEEVKEIKAEELNPKEFIQEKMNEIAEAVGTASAITALSGGVDSSVVTVLGHRVLGKNLKTCFIDNGLMRQDEPQRVGSLFAELGIPIEIIDAREEFLAALKGLTDPEAKREAVTQTFYKKVFGRLVVKSNAEHLLQGTLFTDIEETLAGLKRQHNVLVQLGIDPQEAFGYQIIEPLRQLRKDGVRKVAKKLGLPVDVWNRMPFPGPGLAVRVIGEATPERIELVRKATAITEKELAATRAFQYMAILHQDRVTGMRDGKRDFGLQIEIRCWESVDARTATPSWLSVQRLGRLVQRITAEVPGVVSVTYNITPKPPLTMEAM